MDLKEKLNQYHQYKKDEDFRNQIETMRELINDFAYNEEVADIVKEDVPTATSKSVTSILRLVPVRDKQIIHALTMGLSYSLESSAHALNFLDERLAESTDKNEKYLLSILQNKEITLMRDACSQMMVSDKETCPVCNIYEVFACDADNVSEEAEIVTTNLQDALKVAKQIKEDEVVMRIWRDGKVIQLLMKRTLTLMEKVRVTTVHSDGVTEILVEDNIPLAKAISYALINTTIYTDSERVSEYLTGYASDILNTNSVQSFMPNTYIMRMV